MSRPRREDTHGVRHLDVLENDVARAHGWTVDFITRSDIDASGENQWEASLLIDGILHFIGLGSREIEAKEHAAYQFLLAKGLIASPAMDPLDRIRPTDESTPPVHGAVGPLPLALDPTGRRDQNSTVSQATQSSDGGDNGDIEYSVAVQALDSLRDHSEPQVPAFLTNTLSKALAANTLALSLPTSHPCFQKAWNFSQNSLSACRTLIGKWKMAHQGSSNASASIMGTTTSEPSTSFDDGFALMDESGKLALVLADVLVALTLAINSTLGSDFPTTLESDSEEDNEEEPTLEESLDAGLKLARQIVPESELPPLLSDNPVLYQLSDIEMGNNALSLDNSQLDQDNMRLSGINYGRSTRSTGNLFSGASDDEYTSSYGGNNPVWAARGPTATELWLQRTQPVPNAYGGTSNIPSWMPAPSPSTNMRPAFPYAVAQPSSPSASSSSRRRVHYGRDGEDEEQDGYQPGFEQMNGGGGGGGGYRHGSAGSSKRAWTGRHYRAAGDADEDGEDHDEEDDEDAVPRARRRGR